MSYTPAYPSRINWENEPSTATALNDVNLNKMDYAIYQHDQALQAFDGRISTLESASYVNSFNGRTGAVLPAQDDYTIDQIKATGTAGQYVALDSNGKLAMVTLPAYPTAGHIVVNSSGTSMTQRSKIKFTGNVSVTDDSTNDQTVVNITGGGGGTGGHTILDPSGSSMTQRTNLQFTGTGVSVSDNAGDDKTVVTINGGSGSGGHTIEDADGTALTQRTTMQFKGTLKATDDSTDQKTVIDDTAVEISWADWQDMTEQERETYLAEHPKVDVVGFPDADADLQLDFLTKLWENENPSATFAGQNIQLSSDDYDFLIWEFTANKSSSANAVTIVEKGKNGLLSESYASGSGNINRFRNVVRSSDTIYVVDNGYAGTSSSRTQDNDVCVPLAVYGFKKKITVTVDAIAEDVSTSASKCMLDENTSVADVVTANKIDSRTEITSYASTSNMFTVPADGFVSADVRSQSGFLTLKIVGASGSAYSETDGVTLSATHAISGGSTVNSTFVRKGMRVYVSAKSGTAYAWYYKLS